MQTAGDVLCETGIASIPESWLMDVVYFHVTVHGESLHFCTRSVTLLYVWYNLHATSILLAGWLLDKHARAVWTADDVVH
jgi:hypothetical protein